MQIVGSMRENKELLDYVKKGMLENVETIKKNIAFLKAKS
jgi:hypothetical protein